MKTMMQFIIILLVSLAGEGIALLVPFPLPGSVWGLAILLGLLCSRAIKLSQVENVADYLIYAMPVMFVPVAVELIGFWDVLAVYIAPILLILLLSSLFTFFVTGRLAQYIRRDSANKDFGRSDL